MQAMPSIGNFGYAVVLPSTFDMWMQGDFGLGGEVLSGGAIGAAGSVGIGLLSGAPGAGRAERNRC